MKKPETLFRERCDSFLNCLDRCFHESIQQVAIHGTCDKLVAIQGHGLWVELKAEGKTPDPLQAYKLSKWRAAGCFGIVWSPENDMDVKNFLTRLNAGVLDRALLSKINKEENR